MEQSKYNHTRFIKDARLVSGNILKIDHSFHMELIGTKININLAPWMFDKYMRTMNFIKGDWITYLRKKSRMCLYIDNVLLKVDMTFRMNNKLTRTGGTGLQHIENAPHITIS